MAGWPTKILGDTTPISAPGEYLSYTLREPVGVVGQIIPWNFPLLMAAWKLGPGARLRRARSCSSPPSRRRCRRSTSASCCSRRGFPAGVVNIVTGFGDAGAALAAHDDVDKVAFTGSTEVGKLIVGAAAGNLKKVSLELGGKSPNVVFADADIDVGDRRRRQRDLLQPRPVLQRRLAPLHPEAGPSTRSSRASPSRPRRSPSVRASTRAPRWGR